MSGEVAGVIIAVLAAYAAAVVVGVVVAVLMGHGWYDESIQRAACEVAICLTPTPQP